MKGEEKSHIENNKIVLYWNWKSIVATTCAIIMIPIFALFIFSLTMKNTLINPNFYKTNLKAANTYDRILNEAIPSLIMDSGTPDADVSNILVKKGIIYIIQKSIPATWVENETNSLIDTTTQYIANPNANQKIIVGLNEFKSYIEEANDGLLILEQIIPSCKDASQSTEASKLLNVSIDCSSMTMNLDQIKANIKNFSVSLDKFSQTEIDLSKKIESGLDTITQIQTFAKNIQSYYIGSIITLIILALIITIIKFKNIIALCKYLSLPISISALLVLITTFITNSISLNLFAANSNWSLNPDVQAIITDVIKFNINAVFYYAKIASSISLAVSLAIYITMIVIERTNLKKR